MRSVSRTAASCFHHGSDPKARPSASSVGGQASSTSLEKTATVSGGLERSGSTDAGHIYVETVLDRYLWLPGTPPRTSRQDRRLARALYERGIPLATVQAALLLGASRRTLRAKEAPPLAPIRTLHYFLPLVEEVRQNLPAAGYCEYLESRLRPWADIKVERVWRLESG